MDIVNGRGGKVYRQINVLEGRYLAVKSLSLNSQYISSVVNRVD